MDNKTFGSIFHAGLFDEQVHLVTGGGTGIGRCIAHELASLGATVVVAGRRPEPLAATVAEIAEAGGRAHALPLNIRDREAVDAAVAKIVEDHGRLDGLVNNAGGQFASPASAIRPKGWDAVIDTNLNGTWWATQAAFTHAMADSGGAIVNMVADMWNGFPGMAHTGAARAAVVNLTKTLAVEWAPSGVRVNAVAPGYVRSSGMANYPEPVQALAAKFMPQTPSGRAGTESEVSAVVVFLLSPAAAYVNGHTIRVDGGSSLQKVHMIPPVKHKKMPRFEGFHLDTHLPPIFEDV